MVQPSTSAKYLAITINNKLSFKQHIILLENRVARSVEIVANVSYYLPFNTLITLYYALVHSQLLYALPIWASTYKTYLNKLEKLQNKALRIIFKTPLRDPITPLYRRSGILKLNNLFDFEVAKLMHQIIHKKFPIILNHILHIHLISQHTPLVKNLQTICFYLVFMLLERNDP